MARRLVDGPIIDASTHPSLGDNIQGPSLIRVPDWVPNPLGTYYLYFADHKGRYIRLAHAEQLTGPWNVHPPGSLQLEHSCFPTDPPVLEEGFLEEVQRRLDRQGIELLHDLELELTTPHIASPDVHVDHRRQRIVMYFHGLEGPGHQITRVATSADGIGFVAEAEPVIGRSYLRTFSVGDDLYGMAMPGQLYRSTDGFRRFEEGPTIFEANMRHFAVLVREGLVHVFWTRVGDAPERILVSVIDTDRPFSDWRDRPAAEIMRPERPWEGADAPVEPSLRSVAYGLVNQLRDPAVHVEGDRTYLLYAAGGESCIGLAELRWVGD